MVVGVLVVGVLAVRMKTRALFPYLVVVGSRLTVALLSPGQPCAVQSQGAPVPSEMSGLRLPLLGHLPWLEDRG